VRPTSCGGGRFAELTKDSRGGGGCVATPNTPDCQWLASHDCETGRLSNSAGWAANARGISQEIGVQVYHTGWPNFKEKNRASLRDANMMRGIGSVVEKPTATVATSLRDGWLTLVFVA
jgi:hypothetical protein